MSGIRNQLSQIEESMDCQEISKYKAITLEKDQPFHFTFNQDIKVEPQQSIFQDQSLELQNQIKEQFIEKEIYQLYQPIRQTIGLCKEYQQVKEILQDLRLIQQVIIAASNQKIYSPYLGFDSQEEQSLKIEISQPNFFKKQICESNSAEKSTPPLHHLFYQILNIEDKSQKHQSMIQQYNNQQTDKIMISIPEQSFRQPAKLIKKINMIKAFSQYKIKKEEKLEFLGLFQKLLSLKRGILTKLNQAKENNDQHICEICGKKFISGRKLGGHKSRKHPKNASEYELKKQIQKTKLCQKNRRDYFKSNAFLHKKRKLEKKQIKKETT